MFQGSLPMMYRSAKRYSIPGLIVLLLAIVTLPSGIAMAGGRVFTQAALAQVWGQRGEESYNGYQSQVTFYAPSITSGWASGPSGITWLTRPPFIESGPTKACDYDCGLHPYASWTDAAGNYGENVVLGTTLSNGGRYTFKGWFVGNNQWQAQGCWGGTCYALATPNLGSSLAMDYVASGGEGACGNCPIGNVYTENNQYMKGGTTTWVAWCYSSVRNNVNGSITGCGSTQNWTVKYP